MLSNTYIEKGITVKGAVDFPTWVASWNEKCTVQLFTKRTTTSDGLDGYCMGFSENPTDTGINVNSDTEGHGNTLYFPRTGGSTVSTYSGYWLASASTIGYQVVYINMDGGVTAYWYDQNLFGVRPAVYLPSNIQAEKMLQQGYGR